MLNGLSVRLNSLDYSTWIESLVPLCEKDGVVILVTKTISAKYHINKNLIGEINECLDEKFPFSIITKIEVIAEVEKEAYQSGSTTTVTPRASRDLNVDSMLVKEYTFENFVIGKSNEIAVHAAKNVALKPGREQAFMSFNPLFIYSGVGLGKTHLLHAIGNDVVKNSPRLKVLYIPAETLSNDYMRASINQSKNDADSFNINSFREKYINNDVLLLDDIQFLENKPGSQEVLFNIFNHLILGGSQLVIASDRPPADIPTLEDRLISRLQGGLLIEIRKPSLETRISIVRKKMEQLDLNLDDEIVYFIAENIDTNIRDLEGNLKGIKLYSRIIGKITPTLSMVKDLINKELSRKEGVDSKDILEAVAHTTGISIDKIIGPRRNKDYVEARDMAIFLMREYLNFPYVSIGQIIGGRDHSTITHSYDKTTEKIKTSKDFAKKIEDLKIYLNL